MLNKAESILRAHGVMGVDAQGVGEAELAVGLPRLRRVARQAGVTLLCANARDRAGRNPFTPRTIERIDGVRVGLFAVLQLKPGEPGARATLTRAGIRLQDSAAAARRQVQALLDERAEVIVMLAHTGMARAKELARQISGIHLVVVAGTGLEPGVPLQEGSTYLVETGRGGQSLGHVQLRLGAGWTASSLIRDDSTRHVTYREARDEIERIRSTPSRRPDGQDPRLERARTLARRLRELQPPRGPHTLIADVVTLDGRFPDDPAVKGLLDATRGSWVPRGPAARVVR